MDPTSNQLGMIIFDADTSIAIMVIKIPLAEI